MWLFHPLGFASIVESQTDPTTLVVRGRFAGDLQKLFPGCRVRKTPNRDYMYRTNLARDKVAERLAELAKTIDYGNFKDTITDESRHQVYSDVWELMFMAGDQPELDKPEKDEAA